jgi:hypothetical protein
MGRLIPAHIDRGAWIDAKIRRDGCITLVQGSRMYFFPRDKLHPAIYRALQDDMELREDLRLFLLKETVIPHGN